MLAAGITSHWRIFLDTLSISGLGVRQGQVLVTCQTMEGRLLRSSIEERSGRRPKPLRIANENALRKFKLIRPRSWVDRWLKNPEPHASRMLGVREAAAYLNVSQSWLNKRRVYGHGPRFAKFGRRVNYLISDLDAFAASNRRQNTSQQSSD